MNANSFAGFRPSLLKFLSELEANNDRNWFEANRQRYESDVLTPALSFIEAMAPRLRAISPHFQAVAKKSGGSLMRVYRDTRFSADKRPYKTNVGIQFRHELGKDVHAPGFYLHFEPQSLFLGAGIWRPDSPALAKIRRHIGEHQKAWLQARDDGALKAGLELVGDLLKRPPKGYGEDHPLIEDLKRKDFIGSLTFSRKELHDPAFIDQVADAFYASRPFMRFLCQALTVPF